MPKYNIKKMRDALKQSNEQLEMLRGYVSQMRSQVHGNLKAAMRCGFTYIDLDTLDDVSIQIMRNKSAMSSTDAKSKKVKS